MSRLNNVPARISADQLLGRNGDDGVSMALKNCMKLPNDSGCTKRSGWEKRNRKYMIRKANSPMKKSMSRMRRAGRQ